MCHNPRSSNNVFLLRLEKHTVQATVVQLGLEASPSLVCQFMNVIFLYSNKLALTKMNTQKFEDCESQEETVLFGREKGGEILFFLFVCLFVFYTVWDQTVVRLDSFDLSLSRVHTAR